jgi:hypothetical protein
VSLSILAAANSIFRKNSVAVVRGFEYSLLRGLRFVDCVSWTAFRGLGLSDWASRTGPLGLGAWNGKPEPKIRTAVPLLEPNHLAPQRPCRYSLVWVRPRRTPHHSENVTACLVDLHSDIRKNVLPSNSIRCNSVLDLHRCPSCQLSMPPRPLRTCFSTCNS